MNPVFAEIGTSVFETMSRLARERQAVNLGQGFPDDPGPEDVRAKAAEAVLHGWNQYPPMLGLPELRNAVAQHYRRFQGLDFDPETEIMVTSGATEALAGALLALIEPGDEVVLIEPIYDAYLPLVRRAGGIARFVTLRPPHWTIDEAELAAAFSDRTKVVIVNNPHNPIGVAHGREALERIAKYCRKHDVIALCDEVWEHLTFDGRAHVSMMAIEGMRERTVKIGSAGKIFSLTGWKVGWVCAPARILKTLARAHQFITFTTPPNLQIAVAYGLMKDEDYFVAMRARFQRSRDRFSQGLAERGFDVLPSAATYFVNIDISAMGPRRRRRLLPRPGRDAWRRRHSGFGLLRQRAGPHGPCASASPRWTRRWTPRWRGLKARRTQRFPESAEALPYAALISSPFPRIRAFQGVARGKPEKNCASVFQEIRSPVNGLRDARSRADIGDGLDHPIRDSADLHSPAWI